MLHHDNISAGNYCFLNTNASNLNSALTMVPTLECYLDRSKVKQQIKCSKIIFVYVWHSVEGYSKFGSYEGNGNTDGPFIYTGFRPVYLFIKNDRNGR